MGAKGSAEAAAKLNADNWGHLEVCVDQRLGTAWLRKKSVCSPRMRMHETHISHGNRIFPNGILTNCTLAFVMQFC